MATVNRFCSDYPVLFGYKVIKITVETQPSSLTTKESNWYTVKLQRSPLAAKIDGVDLGPPELNIRATSIVDASGIGDADYTAIQKFRDVGETTSQANRAASATQASMPPLQRKVTQLKRETEEFVTCRDGEFGGLANQQGESKGNDLPLVPRITHSQDFYRALSLLSDPYAPFVGKTVVVVGTGDSARTILEFLFRINTAAAAYGEGTNETVRCLLSVCCCCLLSVCCCLVLLSVCFYFFSCTA